MANYLDQLARLLPNASASLVQMPLMVSRVLCVAALAAVGLLCAACRRNGQSRPAVRPVLAGPAAAAAPTPALRFRQLPLSPALTGAGQAQLVSLNGDDWPDAVAALSQEDSRARESRLRVMLGDGRGGFDLLQTVAIPFLGVHVYAAGDFNGDGTADLATAAHDSYNAWLLFGTGQGGLSLAPQPLAMYAGAHPHTHSLAAADMNGDGRQDLLAACADDNAVAVQLQLAGGGFAPAPGSPFAAGVHPYEGLACADVNGDGRLDCVVPNLQGDGVSVLLGDGHGALAQAPGSPLRAGPRPGCIALGDLDADGRLDIAASHDDDALLAVYYGDGHGGFVPADGSPFQVTARLWTLQVVDMDAGGTPELVGAEVGGAVAVYPGGRYAGSIPRPQRVTVAGGQLQNCYAADFNGDGRLDLLANFWDVMDNVVLLQESGR